MLFSDIDAGFCLYGKVFPGAPGERLILPVDLFNIFFGHIKYIAVFSVPVAAADLSDAVSPDKEVHKEAENGKTDDKCEFFQQIIQHGNAHPLHGSRMGSQKDQQDCSISEDARLLIFLDSFTEGDPAYDFFKHDTQSKACPNAYRLRPA